MAVTQYIGARYVPIFAEPDEWDNTKKYEPLTIVLHEGNSYTSKQAVPVGIDINDTKFWAQTGNYNAQVEGYRREVRAFDGRITANADAITDLSDDLASETLARSNNDATLDGKIDSTKAELQGQINSTKSELEAEMSELATKKNYIGIIGDSFSVRDGVSQTFDYWPKILSDKTEFNVINKATGASGFCVGNTFESQLDELISDPNFDKVSHIIVYGGANDWFNNKGVVAVRDAVNSLMNKYNSIPKANRPKLYICFGNIGKANLAVYNGFYSWYNSLIWAMKNNGVPVVDFVHYWHMATSGMFLSDDLHPTQQGQGRIAMYMTQILNGTYSGVHVFTSNDSSLKYNGRNYDAKVTIDFNNGVVNTGFRAGEALTLTPENEKLYDFGAIFTDDKCFTIGTDAGAYLNVLQFSHDIYEVTDGAYIGLFRAIFNTWNKHWYFKIQGSAAGFGNSLTIGADATFNMVSHPSSF